VARAQIGALLLALFASACATERAWQRRDFAYLGVRALDGEWEPFERQIVPAVQLAFEPVDATETELGYEIGLNLSGDSDRARDSRWAELSFGGTKTIELVEDGVYTNAGVGFALLWVSEDAPAPPTGSDSDLALGAYMHIGLFWRLTNELDLGLDLRGGDGVLIELSGDKREADYLLLSAAVRF